MRSLAEKSREFPTASGEGTGVSETGKDLCSGDEGFVRVEAARAAEIATVLKHFLEHWTADD